MSSFTDPVFFIFLGGFVFLLYVYHFLIEKPKTYIPFTLASVLCLVVGIIMYSQGVTVECGTFQDQLCLDPRPAANPTFCNDWQWDYNTTYCTNLPVPFIGDTNPAWNPGSQDWNQAIFNANDIHSRTNDQPSYGVTLASYTMIVFGLLGIFNVLRLFVLPLTKRKM